MGHANCLRAVYFPEEDSQLSRVIQFRLYFFSILVKMGFQVEALRSTSVLFVAKNSCCSKMMMMMGLRKITNSLVVICILAFKK